MSDTGSPGGPKPDDGSNEHLNIKVTDNNNEVFFKIKRTTQLKKLMDAFCERQGKSPASVRFLFDGQRVQPTDNPDTVSIKSLSDLRTLHRSMTQSLTRVTSARHAGRRHARGSPRADWRLLIFTPQPPSYGFDPAKPISRIYFRAHGLWHNGVLTRMWRRLQ